MHRPSWLLATALTLAAISPVRADEGERPRELVPGDTAFGQEAGEYEIAFETTYQDGVEEDEVELRIGFEYGLTERIQLGVEVPYLFVDPDDEDEESASGLDLAEIALQLALLDAESPAALALAFEAHVPVTGREGPGDDEAKAAAALLVAALIGRNEIFGGIQATWSDAPTELELELGAVFPTGRIATEVALTWTDDGESRQWELRPELVIEDVGPVDVGIAAYRAFLDGPDEWGLALTVTYGP